MTNLSKEVTEVGMTVIPVSQILEQKETTTALSNIISAKDSEIAVLNEKIKNLELQQKVIVKEKSRYGGEDIIEYRNLSDVQLQIRKEEEEKLGKELIRLKAEVEKSKNEIKILEESNKVEIQYLEKKNNLVSDKYLGELRNKDREYELKLDEKNKEIEKSLNAAKERELQILEDAKKLQDKLDGKIQEDSKDTVIEKLTESYQDLKEVVNNLRNSSKIRRFVKSLMFWKNSEKFEDYLNGWWINDLRTKFLERETALPKYFNKYATWKIVDENTHYNGTVTVRFKY